MNLRARMRAEEGYTTLWVLFLGGALLSIGSVVYDSADKAAAQRVVMTTADEASRAASHELESGAIIGQRADVDPQRAAAAARTYLDNAGQQGTVSVNGQSVTVTVTQSWSPTFTPIVPSQTLTATSSADARRS